LVAARDAAVSSPLVDEDTPEARLETEESQA
jgi:hypothetical protein